MIIATIIGGMWVASWTFLLGYLAGRREGDRQGEGRVFDVLALLREAREKARQPATNDTSEGRE